MLKHMKIVLNSNLESAKQKHKLTKEDINKFANTLAVSFKGYSLFEYMSYNNYDIKKMETFWKVNLHNLPKSTFYVTESDEVQTLAVLSPYEKPKFSIIDYIKAGGLKLLFTFPLKCINRISSFEKIALKIREKYAEPGCCYLYLFGTRPESRCKGHGGRVFREVLNILDQNNQSCYLETLYEGNVPSYEKYGFILKETTKLKGTDLTIYALYRPKQK